MESPADRLIRVLLKVRENFARAGTDFVWSSWENDQAALAELDRAIEQVRTGTIPKANLDVLFAPTGDIQEVSISNGWGEAYLVIAEEYGEAMFALGVGSADGPRRRDAVQQAVAADDPAAGKSE